MTISKETLEVIEKLDQLSVIAGKIAEEASELQTSLTSAQYKIAKVITEGGRERV